MYNLPVYSMSITVPCGFSPTAVSHCVCASALSPPVNITADLTAVSRVCYYCQNENRRADHPLQRCVKNRRVDMATPLACGQGEETVAAKGTGSLLAREAYVAP